jgi:hypothetical protein
MQFVVRCHESRREIAHARGMTKLASVALVLCSSCASRPASRTLAGELRSDEVSAKIEIDYTPNGCGALSFKCSDREAVRHELEVDADGVHREATLVLALPGEHEFDRLLTSRYELAISSDRHALALRLGTAWRYVGLDAPVPLYCVHRATPAPSWSTSTRDLALEILRSKSSAGTVDHTARVFEHPGDEFGRELRAAAAYAVAHSDDPPLAEALAMALVTPCPGGELDCDAGFGANAGEMAETDAEIATAGRALGRSVALQQVYRHAITAGVPDIGETQHHAIEALGSVADADTEAFLFDVIPRLQTSDNLMSGPEYLTCLLRRDALRSLAFVITGTRSVSRPNLEQLIVWAEHDTLCSGLDTPDAVAFGGAAARAYAVSALVASGSPEARRVVEQLASAPCATPIDHGTPLPSIWDKRWDGADETSCWARAALR